MYRKKMKKYRTNVQFCSVLFLIEVLYYKSVVAEKICDFLYIP